MNLIDLQSDASDRGMVAIGPKCFKPTVIVKLKELIKPYIPDIRWGHQVRPK